MLCARRPHGLWVIVQLIELSEHVEHSTGFSRERNGSDHRDLDHFVEHGGRDVRRLEERQKKPQLEAQRRRCRLGLQQRLGPDVRRRLEQRLGQGGGDGSGSDSGSGATSGSASTGAYGSLATFGHPASGGDKAAVLVAFHRYLSAIAAGNWAAACALLSTPVKSELTKLLAHAHGISGHGCAAGLGALLGHTSPSLRQQQAALERRRGPY